MSTATTDRITKNLLIRHGARSDCDELAKFVAVFPDGVEPTEKAYDQAVEANLDLEWLAERILPKAALAEYERVSGQALAEYQRVSDQALAEYERVSGPALAEYQRVRGQAIKSTFATQFWAKTEEGGSDGPETDLGDGR